MVGAGTVHRHFPSKDALRGCPSRKPERSSDAEQSERVVGCSCRAESGDELDDDVGLYPVGDRPQEISVRQRFAVVMPRLLDVGRGDAVRSEPAEVVGQQVPLEPLTVFDRVRPV